MSESVQDNEKTIGIISYLTIIGWIIALVMHNKDKTAYGAFHIRQALGLIVLYLVAWIIYFGITYVGIPFLGNLVILAVVVLWILGFIGAVQGEKKPVPLVGEQFQDWFKSVG